MFKENRQENNAVSENVSETISLSEDIKHALTENSETISILLNDHASYQGRKIQEVDSNIITMKESLRKLIATSEDKEEIKKIVSELQNLRFKVVQLEDEQEEIIDKAEKVEYDIDVLLTMAAKKLAA